jgi:hypothetical protein
MAGRSRTQFVAIGAALMLVAPGCGNSPEQRQLPDRRDTSVSASSTPGTRQPSPTPRIDLYDGSDQCAFRDAPDVLFGTEANDHLVAHPGLAFVCAGSGDDTIEGAGVEGLTVYGGPGNDRISGARMAYGNDGNDVIEGTGPSAGGDIDGGDGDDHLSSAERVSGGDGNDETSNATWTDGGPGNDNIAGTPLARGGDGDDVLEYTGPKDPKVGQTVPIFDGDGGNDVLLAGAVVHSSDLDGGPGNDLLVGAPVALSRNLLDGGAGSDVAMALNLSRSINADIIDLDGKSLPDAAVTVGACKVTVPVDSREPRQDGKASCRLPWPQELSGLGEDVSLSVSVGGDGKLSLEASLYDGLAKLTVSEWRDLVTFQASIGEDICLCDPLVPLGTILRPEQLAMPLDWSA